MDYKLFINIELFNDLDDIGEFFSKINKLVNFNEVEISLFGDVYLLYLLNVLSILKKINIHQNIHFGFQYAHNFVYKHGIIESMDNEIIKILRKDLFLRDIPKIVFVDPSSLKGEIIKKSLSYISPTSDVIVFSKINKLSDFNVALETYLGENINRKRN